MGLGADSVADRGLTGVIRVPTSAGEESAERTGFLGNNVDPCHRGRIVR